MAEASDRRPAPSATGTLATTPLAHALIYARNRRLTGTFELHAPDGRHSVLTFWRGRISDVRSTPSPCYFGAVVYELGFIDSATLDSTLLEVAQKKQLHGEILVGRGAITKAQRDDALHEQACRKVHDLFGYPGEAAYSFYESKPSAEEPAMTVEPLTPIWRGIRDYPHEASVRIVLTKFGMSPMRMVNEAPLDRVGFGPEERELVDMLSVRAMNVGQMRASTSLNAARVDLLAYLLLIAKCVEPVAASDSGSMPAASGSQPRMPAAPSSSPRLPLPPPSASRIPPAPPISSPRIPTAPESSRGLSRLGSTPAMARVMATPGVPIPRTISTPGMPAVGSGEMRRPGSFGAISVPRMPAVMPRTSSAPPEMTRTPEPPVPVLGPAELGAMGIAARAQSIEQTDYFEILGVETGASTDAVRAAYFRLAKLWHPDRLPDDLSAFRSEVEAIFSQMTRAHRTLTDPEARRGYLSTRNSGPPKRPRAEVIRDIDTALTKRDLVTAEAEARKLHDADLDDAEALAIVAWTSAACGEAPLEDTLRASLSMLDRAVNADRYCDRAYYYRGMIQKRLGNPTAAVRDFTRASQVNPKHVDAEREVRLFEMRQRKGSGEHALGGLFSKTKK